MIGNRFNKLFEEMFDEMHDMQQLTRTVDHDGYRVDIVNGKKTEYIYDDGNWKQIGRETFEITETESGQTLVADLSDKITDGQQVTDASINNGVLEVTFESEDSSTSDE